MDIFLGGPFNIASYALLTKMIAQVVNMEPLEFVWTTGDTHIYANHLEAVDKQLAREPLSGAKLIINKRGQTIDEFQYSDFDLIHYESHAAISAPVAV